MTTISEKDRAEAQAMFKAAGGLTALGDIGVRRWLPVDHVLATHECPTVPVWRPVIDGEDLTGHEVRARSNGADWWGAWGVAYRRSSYGNWVTKGGAVLTGGWPVTETTAPLPEPEPWDEALVGVVSDALAGTEDTGDWDDDARRVLDALAARGYLDRAAITGGERS